MGLDGGLNKKQESVFTREPNLKSEDFYERLGLDNKASDKQITRAFRELAKKHHTDTGSGNLENAQLIGEAYEALEDPEKRAAYDMSHAALADHNSVHETRAETEQGFASPSNELRRDKNGRIIIAGDLDISVQKMGYENLEAFSRANLSQSSQEKIEP